MPQDPNTLSGPTENAPRIALARLGKVTQGNDGVADSDWVDVHFNPATLQLQVSNQLKDQPNLERKQYVAKTSAKLTMDLPFDFTETGADVTQTTRKLQAFIAPPLPEGDRARRQIPPPLVMFEWGTLRFKGIVESYKETIDFFSADGVPLRASVNLTLSRQDQVFDPASGRDSESPNQANQQALFDVPATSASNAAGQGGTPEASRAIAAANGQENLRFGTGSPLTLGEGVTLRPAAAFSAGPAGGFGISGGVSVGGAGISAKASGAASAGVAFQARLSATQGAFAALRMTARGPAAIRLDPGRMIPRLISANLETRAGAQFQVGGRAGGEGPAGLRADVGVSAKLSFDQR